LEKLSSAIVLRFGTNAGGTFGGRAYLLEGVPDGPRTLAVKSLSEKTIDAKFQRIQFTPDLLPSDLIGTLIYQSQISRFSIKKGPVFANYYLGTKSTGLGQVQSALLEAMQEKQVTIGETTFPHAASFLFLATQNPIEQEELIRCPKPRSTAS